jgi:hypothetical protein
MVAGTVSDSVSIAKGDGERLQLTASSRCSQWWLHGNRESPFRDPWGVIKNRETLNSI